VSLHFDIAPSLSLPAFVHAIAWFLVLYDSYTIILMKIDLWFYMSQRDSSSHSLIAALYCSSIAAFFAAWLQVFISQTPIFCSKLLSCHTPSISLLLPCIILQGRENRIMGYVFIMQFSSRFAYGQH